MGEESAIVIDGPAGVGKSTIAKALARKLGYTYVDTGAMYRTVTLFALEKGIPIDEDHQEELLGTIEGGAFAFVFVGDDLQVRFGPRDLSQAIRSPEVTGRVSQVAALPLVRRGLRLRQREIAQKGKVVMEGRDIGTVVLPQARHKFFLTAAPGERARRRYQELRAQGREVEYAQICREIEKRDELDSTREHDPLRQAEDAVLVDTTTLDAAAVVALVIQKLK